MSSHAQETLDPVGGANSSMRLITFDAAVDSLLHDTSPRIVQVGSLDGAPFAALLSWTAAGGDAAQARFTCAAGTRVCVMARTLALTVTNLHNSTNRVVATVADGFATTWNVYEVWYGSAPSSAVLTIPAWASHIEMQAGAGATGSLVFKTSTGATLGVVALGSIPAGGALIGAASTIEVTCSTACRVLYRLTL